MEADHDPKAPGTGGPRRIVRCALCARTIECEVTDLLRYTREGWPKCCKQVMTFFTETKRPGPAPPPAEGPNAG